MPSNPLEPKDYKKFSLILFLKKYQLILIISAITTAFFLILIIILGDDNWKGYSPIISILTSIFAALCCAISLEYYEKRKKQIFDSDLENRLENIEKKLSIDNKEGIGAFREDIVDVRDGLERIDHTLPLLSSGILKAGLESSFKGDIDTYYKESDNATSVLIHGNSFINNHKDAIISRFNKPDSVSKWFFLNPDSDYLSLVAKRTKKNSSEDVKKLIIEKVNLLKDEYENSNKSGILEIFYMDNPPMQAVYVFDQIVIECKYYSSNEKGAGNYMIFYEKNNVDKKIGNGFADDCNKLEKESICSFSSRYYNSDQDFNKYLIQNNKTICGALVTSMNNYDSLSFVPIKNKGKIVMYFCYRYYHNTAQYQNNNNFYKYQFKKKTEELKVSANGKEVPRLFFIVGIGGSSSSPRTIKRMRYDYPDKFIQIQNEGFSLALRSFGYNSKREMWNT